MTLSNSNSYTGGTNLGGGGTVNYGNLSAFGSGTVNWGWNETIQAGLPGTLANNLTVGNNNAIFDTQGYAVTLTGSFNVGSGGRLNKSGVGTLTLTSSDRINNQETYPGSPGIVVANGTLAPSLPTPSRARGGLRSAGRGLSQSTTLQLGSNAANGGLSYRGDLYLAEWAGLHQYDRQQSRHSLERALTLRFERHPLHLRRAPGLDDHGQLYCRPQLHRRARYGEQ